MKYLAILIPIVISVIIPAFADDATQTDWSGGPGRLRPVWDWLDDYDESTNIGLPPDCFTLGNPEYVVGDPHRVRSIYASDIDGDYDNDVLIGYWDNGSVVWRENLSGYGDSWVKHNIGVAPEWVRSVCVDDVDADGDTDVFASGCESWPDYSGEVILWINDDGFGENWIEYTVDDNIDGVIGICTADIDSDSDIDIIAYSLVSDYLIWYENEDGTGTSWGKNIVDGDYNNGWSLDSKDIDGDNDFDIVSITAIDGDIAWWSNDDGYGTNWTKHFVVEGLRNGSSVYSEDVDGDSDMDIMCAYHAGLSWWENNDSSGTSWTEHTVDDEFYWAKSVYPEDVDGDGDIDILGAAQFDENDNISWWENNDGSGTSWTEHILKGDYARAYEVFSADINGDGINDVIGAEDWYNEEFIWWDLSKFETEGSLTSSILWLRNYVIDWGAIEWNWDIPSGTTVTVEIRASVYYDDMGDWVTVNSPGDLLSDYFDEGLRYFQYKISLTSDDSSITPTFEDITIYWTPMGIDGDEGNLPTTFALHPVAPNPSSGSATIGFALPRACDVELALYDIKGRKVAMLATGQHQPGEYSATVSGLASGIYVYQMIAGEFSDSKKMVVK